MKDILQNDELKNVIPINDEKVIVQCKDRTQHDKLKQVLKKAKEISVKTDKTRKPTFRLTGITNGYTVKELNAKKGKRTG